MTNRIDASAMLERMRAGAKTGLEQGTWFSPIEENIGVEIFGTVNRIFEYEFDNENRIACELRTATDTTFVLAKDGETETVEVAAGELLLIGLSGQLRHIFETYSVGAGTVAFLRYEGKDTNKKIRGNHPHNWTYNFVNPQTGEVSD